MPDSFLTQARPSKAPRTAAQAHTPVVTSAQAAATHARLLAVLAAAAQVDARSALEATRALFEWLDDADTLEDKGRHAQHPSLHHSLQPPS